MRAGESASGRAGRHEHTEEECPKGGVVVQGVIDPAHRGDEPLVLAAREDGHHADVEREVETGHQASAQGGRDEHGVLGGDLGEGVGSHHVPLVGSVRRGSGAAGAVVDREPARRTAVHRGFKIPVSERR